ncbi:hypothetical protein AMK26_14075 [Streptomyces sp. CB03234]|nr:hypothetical protein AMK26_14075 [Streptomyces sp. CB03234]
MLWGPAAYDGRPPGWLVVEGLTVGVVGAAAIATPGIIGVLADSVALRTGEAGVVVAAGLAVYLAVTGAGRALVGVAAVLGVFWGLLTPRAVTEAVLLWDGEVRSVVVTSVAPIGDATTGRRYCSVRHMDGTPVSVRIWRGCERTTGPGDHISLVSDPKGRVPPRGVPASGSLAQPLTETAGTGLLLVTVSAVAAVRSYRLAPDSHPMPAPDAPQPA